MIIFIFVGSTYLGIVAAKSRWPSKIIYFFGHVGFHVTLSYILWHAHALWILIYVTLCKTKWDHHSFLNQWEVLESCGHGHLSLHVVMPV